MTSDRSLLDTEDTLHIAELKVFVERMMFQHLLVEEQILPQISIMQLTLGAWILSFTTLSETVKRHIVAAMVLMHHGLSLHDTVREDDSAYVRKGQLTILGGDYLSSLFYKLLADVQQVQVLRAFSEAVGRMNTAKSAILSGASDPLYDDGKLLQDLRTIEGGLLEALADTMGSDASVKQLTEALITAKVTAERPRFIEVWHDALRRCRLLGTALLGSSAWMNSDPFMSEIHLRDGMVALEGR